MSDVDYGVVKQGDRWLIIGDNLRFGSYQRRSSAVRAARRLAAMSLGPAIHLHLQAETGELLAPERVDSDD